MSGSLEAKIVVLGAQGVGKTSLVHRFVKNSFTPPSMMTSTIGASFLTKRVVDIDSQTVVRLQIWDTAGQERFRSISKLYYRGANAAILCYDITSASSFTEMGHWLVELRSTLPEDTILHVVGTKSDIVAETPATREVPFERCIAYVAENLYPTSAQHSSQFQPSTAPTGDYFASAATDGKVSHHRTKSSSNVLGHRASKSASNLLIRDEPVASPHSNRSSMGFWGQDLGWDCCHEVSAASGEGVEEVFRVITRRLVEQRNSRAALEARFLQEFGGMTPGIDERSSFYNEYGNSGDVYGGNSGTGSFRVGHGDKRRSWLGLANFASISGDEGGVGGADSDSVRRQRKGCC